MIWQQNQQLWKRMWFNFEIHWENPFFAMYHLLITTWQFCPLLNLATFMQLTTSLKKADQKIRISSSTNETKTNTKEKFSEAQIRLFSLKSKCTVVFCITFQKAVAGRASQSYKYHFKTTPSALPPQIHTTGNFTGEYLAKPMGVSYINSINLICIYGFGSCYSGWRISKNSAWADRITGDTTSLRPAAEAIIPLKLYLRSCRIEFRQVRETRGGQGIFWGFFVGTFQEAFINLTLGRKELQRNSCCPATGTPETRKALLKSAKNCHAWIKQQAFTMFTFNTLPSVCDAAINN